ncbi:hypothetical protein KVR01_004741 [Diaporthe batatas]|uniref:uncharacterized protein n=1 Tax=Diaporthe batatas TaxID=748121 RepID=UPI001D054829|nr:uncharacterized protein KVR01_004741 [Diaporthe batatas]KAG8166189.1 hypothetical protein KVR01_004741 [Diaporthe batatas]
MSPSRSPAPDADTVMSETRAPESNQLKRKSFGASPDADADDVEDTPNKRQRTNDAPGRSPERHGNGENGNGHGDRRRSSARDAYPKDESRSPDARRQRQASPPEQRRRPSEPARHDDRSPISPTFDRRGSETGRRMSSSHGAERERERRESYSQEEKKRGRRLFGGLLSTLSQTTANTQQKRRLEIEKKQQEKAVKQKSEDDRRRADRLARLDKVRRVEQVRFDEQVMRTRHSNMLAMAHSLRTRSEPKLYYRPWDLTQEQEDIIKDQIRDTEEEIADDVRQFRRDKEQRLSELGALGPRAPSEADNAVGEQAEERSNTAAQDVPANDAAAATNHDRHQRPRSISPAPAPRGSHHEDKDHDEMVEAEEDTVIY